MSLVKAVALNESGLQCESSTEKLSKAERTFAIQLHEIHAKSQIKNLAISELRIQISQLEESLEESLSDLIGVKQRFEDRLKDLESECCAKDATLHEVCLQHENALEESSHRLVHMKLELRDQIKALEASNHVMFHQTIATHCHSSAICFCTTNCLSFHSISNII